MLERWKKLFRAASAKHKAAKVVATDDFLVFLMEIWEDYQNTPVENRGDKGRRTSTAVVPKSAKSQAVPGQPNGVKETSDNTKNGKARAGKVAANVKPSPVKGNAKANDTREANGIPKKENRQQRVKRNSVAPVR